MVLPLLLLLTSFLPSEGASKTDRIIAEQKGIACDSNFGWKGEGKVDSWHGKRNLSVSIKRNLYEVALTHTGLQKNTIKVILMADAGRWTQGLKGVQLKEYANGHTDHKVVESDDLTIKDRSYQLLITKRFFQINGEEWGLFNQVIRCKLQEAIKFN
jgi:hypothetical protein